MATLEMAGPFSYTRETIDEVIPDGYPGNYALGHYDTVKNTFYVQYVGRADKNLRDRIGHSIGKYSHFMASIAENVIEAFQKECQNWHDFGGEKGKLDNKIHPDKPDGEKLAFCPVCVRKLIFYRSGK